VELKIVNRIIVAIVALLSIAAGLAKVMQTPQEMEFLQGLGLSSFVIVVFGLVQIAGGVLMVPKKTRMPGAILVALAFVVSTVLIFMGGNLAFGLFSIIPIALAGVIIYQTARIEHNKSLNTDAINAESS
jgi:hypothetical protein